MAVFAAHYYERAPVHFSWTTAASGTAGEMNATLADGSRFSGSFLQVQSDRLVPPEQIWTGWKYGWRNADWEEFGTAPLFEMLHRGEVIANLMGPRDARMRCRFTLNDRESGMVSGGRSQCHLATGGTVDAIFPRS